MIAKKIQKTVENNPHKIAYKVNEDTITYKELWSLANQYASYLKKQGNTPVIIYGDKEINTVIAILSCIIAKRTYIPIGLCMPIQRLKKIINITKSTLIITEKRINIENITCSNLKNLSKYSKNEIIDSNNDIIYIIFTSGSTGEPKGVPISENNLINFINWLSNTYPLNEYKDANILNQASFSFDLSVADFYYSLCNGHTLIANNNNNQEEYEVTFNIIKNNQINVAVMTPTFMKLCLLNEDFNYYNYPSLKCVYFCGERLENKTVKNLLSRFPELKVINAYGPTEATSAISSILITQEIIDKEELLPVGNMNKTATTVEIIDNEIVLKGPSVSNGYLGIKSDKFYKENNINCYKTGDLGYIKNNKLYCKGRLDNQIKYQGYRIELNDIENNIKKIPDIKDCIVIAKYNNQGLVKLIKAFIISDKSINPHNVKELLKERIPNYMIPKSIIQLKDLPINQNGKIDRKALSEL